MKSELESIAQWLEGRDETQWVHQIALAKTCLATMRQRAKPIKDPNKPGSGQLVFAKNAGHCDRGVKAQTLPLALEYVWQGYTPKK